MKLFETMAKDPKNLQEKDTYPTAKSSSDLILDLLKTLPLHFKLVLYACINLIGQDKKDIKVTVMDVFLEYKKLATESNVNWLSINKVKDFIKELELLGFLKCTYLRKGKGQIKYIRIFEPAEVPKYISILQENFGNIEKNPIAEVPDTK